MRLRSLPPALPAELSERLGPAENVFGPNQRFRGIAALCGVLFVVLGAIFFLLHLSAGGARLPLGDWVGGLLDVPLLALGLVLLIGTKLLPANWVFVCPRGVVRTRGDAWDSVAWDEVQRFEDATLGHRGVTFRQCRLLLKDGREWGFLADHVADYRRLTEVLRQKLAAEYAPPAKPS